MERLLAVLAIVALACVALTGAARTIALARGGVWVLPIDRGRRPREALFDLGFVLGIGVFLFEAIATALVPERRIFDVALLGLGWPWLALRALGAPVAAAGVVLYVRALRDFGLSWRFTIDREQPGDLVTEGVFARSRNPIYLALLLLALGVALLLGSPPLLVLAGAAQPYFSSLIRREERFLEQHYGEHYAEYVVRIPRWWRWPSRRTHRPEARLPRD